MDWPGFAESIGYQAITVRTLKQLNHAIEEWNMNPKLTFVYMKINNKVKDKLGRPKVKPFQVSERFKNYINK
jgi:phosphonopyruvate decarboxylase